MNPFVTGSHQCIGIWSILVFILEEGGERIGMDFRKYSGPTQTLVVQQLMFVLICFTLPRLVMKLTIILIKYYNVFLKIFLWFA